MIYKSYYQAPIGKMLIASNNNKLIGLWLDNQKYYLANLKEELQENNEEKIIVKTKKWLNRYFKGQKPQISELELEPIGSEFRKNVWKLLCNIPYGEITTYRNIAENMAKIMKKEKMSAQAVGSAIGHNPISIIIPCHRVVGTDGNLTGYAGGIDKKIKLLELENVNMKHLYIPKVNYKI